MSTAASILLTFPSCDVPSPERLAQFLEAAPQQLHIELLVFARDDQQVNTKIHLPVHTFVCQEFPSVGELYKASCRVAIDRGFDYVVWASSVVEPDALIAVFAACADAQDDVVGVPRPDARTPIVSAFTRRLARHLFPTTGFPDLTIVAYKAAFLKTVPFETNRNDDTFTIDLQLQAHCVGATIRLLANPPQTSKSTGIRQLNILLALLHYRFHRSGMFCTLRYRDLGQDRYVDKTTMRYSSHALAVKLAEQYKPRSVLDIGCGPGHVARCVRELGIAVTGVDMHDPLPNSTDAFYKVELDESPLPVSIYAYEMVLLLDVIEHFSFPEEFLLAMRQRPDTESSTPTLLISTPNVAFIAMRLNLLLGRFNYAERGILDVTHRRLFTHRSLLRTLIDCGYLVEKVIPVGAPFAAIFPGKLGTLLGVMGDALARLWPGMFAFQFMVVCHPKKQPRVSLAGESPHE